MHLSQLGHAFVACPTSSLVGGGYNSFEPELQVERPQCHGCYCGGAVGVGYKQSPFERMGVDLGDHQGNVLVHPKVRRVVDHQGLPIRGYPTRVLP